MLKTPEQIWQQAKKAAIQAGNRENYRLGPEQARGLDCGFAWVTIRPARGAFVAWLKRQKIGKSGGYDGGTGYGLWYSDIADFPTQSVSVFQASCQEFCRVLADNGISASMGSRLD